MFKYKILFRSIFLTFPLDLLDYETQFEINPLHGKKFSFVPSKQSRFRQRDNRHLLPVSLFIFHPLFHSAVVARKQLTTQTQSMDRSARNRYWESKLLRTCHFVDSLHASRGTDARSTFLHDHYSDSRRELSVTFSSLLSFSRCAFTR